MEKNIILLVVITAIAFFVVGNPITYGIMSKITGLKVKNKKEHMVLVIIHSAVMTLLMYGAFEFLIKDTECPPPPACPSPPPCPVCEEKKQAEQPPAEQPPADQPPAEQPIVEGMCPGGEHFESYVGYKEYYTEAMNHGPTCGSSS